MFRTEPCSGRRPRLIQLDARNHPPTSPQEIKRHSYHRAGLNFQSRIEKFAVARILPHLVLKKRLLAREDHADYASLQRLLEFSNQLIGMGSGVPRRDKKFTRLVQEPDSAFVSARFGEPVLNGLAHQRIEQRTELLGLNASRNPLQAFRESAFQFEKRWVWKDV